MTRTPLPLILQELQNPASSATQLAALKTLKNELIGHEQRKKTWIDFGILSILAGILSSRRNQQGKRANRELHGHGGGHNGRFALSDDNASCLQATVIVGSLAQGLVSIKSSTSAILILCHRWSSIHLLNPSWQPTFPTCGQFGLRRVSSTCGTCHS